MAEVCRDINQGLAALNQKIDEQNKRLRELERKQKECCDKNNKNENSNNSDLEKRVKQLEKDSEALKEGIVGALGNFADIENTNRDFFEAFQGFHDMVLPLVDTVSSIADFLGGD